MTRKKSPNSKHSSSICWLGFVAASLWITLSSVGVALEQLIAITLTYVLVSIFYLVAFWSTVREIPYGSLNDIFNFLSLWFFLWF